MDTDGATSILAHRTDGAGEPLLLLNGGLMSIASWQPLLADLTGRFTVVRCDFRGQLCSPGQPPGDLAGHAADVAAVLDTLAIPQAHVLGTSFGAEVGVMLAARHPDRVRSLVLAAVTDVVTPALRDGGLQLAAACRQVAAGGDAGDVWDGMMSMFYSPAYRESHAGELALRRAQFGQLPSAWFAGIAGLLGNLTDLDLRRDLADVACPTLVVAAELDEIMPVAGARAAAGLIVGARVAVVGGSGHAMIVEKSAELLQLCSTFWSDLEGRGGVP